MYKKLIYLITSVLVLDLAAEIAIGQDIKINFQPEFYSGTTNPIPVPTGYLPDYGYEFGDRGNGYIYGWDVNISGDARKRNYSSDQRKDTLIEMGTATWEIELPNGYYEVFLSCGDPQYDDHISTHDVEGIILVDQNGRSYFDEYDVMVMVSDGRLTIKPGPGAHKCPLLFLHITRAKLFKAYGPVPENDANHPDTKVTLQWLPGDAAVSHDVYLGDNFNDVNDGTSGTSRGNQLDTSFIAGIPGHAYPDGLIPGTTYYWRIDEINDLHPDKLWKGDVWHFKISAKTAFDPDPRNRATFVDPDVELRWSAGLGAILHHVYFGTDEDDVKNANTDSPEYMGPDPNTFFSPGILLDKGKTYYWRIDEYDGVTTHNGDVWSFTTIPDVAKEDPNLLCWWKFDEGSGAIAFDYSGNDHHGVIYGASWVLDGRIGGALDFGGDGDYVVDEDAEEYLNGLSAITVCTWIKCRDIGPYGTDRGFINGEEPSRRDQMVTMRYDRSGIAGGGAKVIKMAVSSTPPEPYYTQQLESSSFVQTTEWQHVAMTWTGGEEIKFYINGIEDKQPTFSSDPCEPGSTITGCTKLIVGKGGEIGATGEWYGLIDDVHIYNKVLTEDEIKEVMRGELDLAYNPSPANSSTPDLHRALPLSWSAGEFASQHDVYFGTNANAVKNADTSDTTGIYRVRQAATTYTPDEGVEWGGGPYYWRIDEYNTDETISKGSVWYFTVADFILVEDFEDYNNYTPDRVFQSWLDGSGYTQPTPVYCGNGTGAKLGHDIWSINSPYYQGSIMETTIVHEGEQSLPYYYDNSGTGTNVCNQLINLHYSEAKLTLDYPRNWTEQDVKALTLWFKGYAAGFKEEPAGTYTMAASGADIWGTADQFCFAYKELSGAGSIEARVLSVENTNDQAKAGVMIRRTLDPESPYAAVYITPGAGCKFQDRESLGSEAEGDKDIATPEQRDIEAPYWVKIEHDSFDNFNGYYSSDGVNWQLMVWSPRYIQMGSNVYIGLALTSHNVNAVCKAQFSDVKTTGTVSPATWTNKIIGTTMLTNDPEPMYVAIANKTGSPAVVYHNDPSAAQIDTWTEWNIDLEEFKDKGINLADVNSIAIGFGNRSNPQAGGSGLMYFDDIRLYRSRCVPDKLTLPEADLNSDCVVDFRDLKIIAGDWLDSGLDLSSDLNNDSTVNLVDYGVLANQWLEEVLWP
jgi:hypothetical protein